MGTASPRGVEGPELDLGRSPAALDALGAEAGFFTVDARARIVGWSAGAEVLTGLARADVAGRSCELLEGPACDGFRALLELLASPRPAAEGLPAEHRRLRGADGREVDVLGWARLLRDGEGHVAGAACGFVDASGLLSERPAARAGSAAGLEGLVGSSVPMREVFRRVRLAADSDVTTLITGESGTGKELAARAIHALSARRGGPFVAVHCAAFPESLLESELFGHVRGAFTGATRDKPGVFESASGGTLFLDEIGDLSALLQLKLLRVLQEREVRRVGDERVIPVDVRLVAATHRDLRERVEAGHMREDFYYRVRVFDVHLPPLRDRLGDVPELVATFLRELGAADVPLTRDALEALLRHRWPGNVRELRNAVERALVVRRGESLEALDLPDDVRGLGPGRRPGADPAAWSAEEEIERRRLLEALEAHGWNRTRTAESLGFSRVTLWKKIRKYRLDPGVFRRGTRDELRLEDGGPGAPADRQPGG